MSVSVALRPTPTTSTVGAENIWWGQCKGSGRRYKAKYLSEPVSDCLTNRELIASGKGGKRTRRQFFPVGTLRRSSSKKLKINVTLFTSVPSPGPGVFTTAKRLPSG